MTMGNSIGSPQKVDIPDINMRTTIPDTNEIYVSLNLNLF